MERGRGAAAGRSALETGRKKPHVHSSFQGKLRFRAAAPGPQPRRHSRLPLREQVPATCHRGRRGRAGRSCLRPGKQGRVAELTLLKCPRTRALPQAASVFLRLPTLTSRAGRPPLTGFLPRAHPLPHMHRPLRSHRAVTCWDRGRGAAPAGTLQAPHPPRGR